jgi:lysophospholipase L1-like esterase
MRRIALLGSGSLVLTILLLESGLRLLGVEPVAVNPDQRHFWAYDPLLGWASRAGASGPFDNGFFRVHVEIGSRGLRGPERPYEKPPGTRRIVVVGDSFAWGFGVEWADGLAARLEAALPDTEVVDGAVSGYSTDQSLIWLRREGLRYEPDTVVYVLSGNDDIMNHMRRAYWIYYKPVFRLAPPHGLVLEGVPVPRASRRERALHALRSRSALARAIETALLGREAAFVNPAHPLPGTADAHRLTVALVNAMRAAARSVGADLVVVATPRFWFSPTGSYARLLAELREAGHDVIDVVAVPGWDAGTMEIPGDGHWNARGHALVAEALAARLGGVKADDPQPASEAEPEARSARP